MVHDCIIIVTLVCSKAKELHKQLMKERRDLKQTPAATSPPDAPIVSRLPQLDVASLSPSTAKKPQKPIQVNLLFLNHRQCVFLKSLYRISSGFRRPAVAL